MGQVTDQQIDVLWQLGEGEDWKTPRMCGGRDGSHHSDTLRTLVKLGYVETKKLHSISCWHGTTQRWDSERARIVRCAPIKSCCCKGSRKYRRTKAGDRAFKVAWPARRARLYAAEVDG